ncbi:MAG: hypothetical protein OXH94_11300 [Rhodospirillales bacterium]|nr:hypothetical protein [Rhodospirillales bacterium]
MLANLDRAQFIELLRTLGEEEDEAVLTAARDIHAKMTVAGVDWDDLLVPEHPDEPEEDEEDYEDDADFDDEDDGDEQGDDLDDDDDDEDDEEDEDERALSDEEKAEALSLITRLLDKGVSADTKEELEEYKQDIDEGEFAAMDLRYLRALHKRLSS